VPKTSGTVMIAAQPKRTKNFMQHQNRPIAKGKRIFLEMRDTQNVAPQPSTS
jgi:hypothetical protein